MKLAQIQIYACDRVVISAGPGRENSSHRHFGAIVAVAREAPITLMSREAEPIVCQAAIVAPNAWHRIDARNATVVTVLIGADHPWFRYVKPLLNGEPIVKLDTAALEGRSIPWDALLEGTCECHAASRAAQSILQAFGGIDAPPHQLDARIEEVLQILREAVTDTPTPDELGRRVGLSGYTLMRRFKAELGVRIREYVLWRRLMVALELVDGRATIADIAQRTGFYDQAHLTRTARRMVELAPSFVNDFSQTRVHVCRE
jgi:AraC-type DNA-binding domain-containing proteins